MHMHRVVPNIFFFIVIYLLYNFIGSDPKKSNQLSFYINRIQNLAYILIWSPALLIIRDLVSI